jgi:hypothetical protein
MKTHLHQLYLKVRQSQAIEPVVRQLSTTTPHHACDILVFRGFPGLPHLRNNQAICDN